MDALERIGLKQFKENTRFADYFRMCEGKVSYIELSELVPQLREVSNLLDDFELPTTIRHYDILGIIINYLRSVISEGKDKFHATNIDEIAANEYQRTKTELVHKYVNEQINNEILLKLTERGLDPSRTDFNSSGSNSFSRT